MSWLADNYGSMAGVDGPTGQALSFTAGDMEGWTPDDHEAAAVAMERDTHDRMWALSAQRDALAADNEWLRERLRDYEDGERDDIA